MTSMIEVGCGSLSSVSLTNLRLAIRKAASWYSQHVASMKVGLRGKVPPSIVLLTDDVENRKRAEAEGVPTSSSTYDACCTSTLTDC